VSLPAADDLFRPTQDVTAADTSRVRAVPDAPAELEPSTPPRPSGRVRHDEKMTVYVTSAELLHLEQARLRLRAEHGLAVDRGRLVREALARVLAEFEADGEESALVRRLTEE
jgi:L-aminopeptidase/D-esterase-like protein